MATNGWLIECICVFHGRQKTKKCNHSINVTSNNNLSFFHPFAMNSLTDFFGYIHDGAGNYSVGVKCSWLIDSREKTVHRNSLRGNDKPPTIRLHLEEFATECGWDHLYVFDGDSVESPLLAVYR